MERERERREESAREGRRRSEETEAKATHLVREGGLCDENQALGGLGHGRPVVGRLRQVVSGETETSVQVLLQNRLVVVLLRELLEVVEEKLLVGRNSRSLLHFLPQVHDRLLVLNPDVAARGGVLLPFLKRHEELVSPLRELLHHVEHVELARGSNLSSIGRHGLVLSSRAMSSLATSSPPC